MDGAPITLAGTGAMSDEGGPVAAASFTHPKGVLAAPDGSTFVTYNHSIRKISTRGIVTTIAGIHLNGIAEGRGGGNRFSMPWSMALTAGGTHVVCDVLSDRLRRVDPKQRACDDDQAPISTASWHGIQLSRHVICGR